MSTQHPFSQHDPFFDNATTTYRPQQGSRWMVILLVVMGFGLLLCGGMITLSYLAIQKAAGVHTEVDLPDELPSRTEDQAAYNQSLARFSANPKADPCVDPRVCEFVRTSLRQLRDGEEIPFSRAMFLEAVAASPDGRGEVGLVERLSINTWLGEYEPTPSIDEPFERILAVRVNDNGDLATVDLLVYSAESQALSQQWYLVKEQDEWKMYDWQRMEYGRRMSDEYAGYVISESLNAEGYDNAMQQLADAQELWWDGEKELARAKIKQCETMPMLAVDRTVALLRTAYTWMAIEQDEETIRVLKMIENPDEVWGVWPVLAACYSSLGQDEQALRALENAAAQSPDHPNIRWLMSVVYDEVGREQESADHAAIALQFCPRDPTIYSTVIDNDRPEDIPLLLDCVVMSEDPFDWTQLLDHAAGSTAWGEQLVSTIQQRDRLAKGLETLARANVAWSKSDFDESAKLFLQARDEVQLPMLREIAVRDHVAARLEDGKIAEAIRESDQPEVTLSQLLSRAVDDALDVDHEALLAALEQVDLGDSPWAAGLRGYANHLLRRYDVALPDLQSFYQWSSERLPSIEEMESESTDVTAWMVDAIASYLTEALVRSGRPMEVLKLWPDEIQIQHEWGSLLLDASSDQLRKQVLAELGDEVTDAVQVQRLRLLARQARLAGDSQICDDYHRQAIELADRLTSEDQAYDLYELIHQRARDAIWNRLADPPMVTPTHDEDQSLRDEFFVEAVREAVIIDDETIARSWIEYAGRCGVDDGPTLAAMQNALADLMNERGQYEQAAEAYRAALNLDDDKDSWRWDRRRREYVGAMLDAGKIDALKQWLEADSSSTAWNQVVVALAAGDADSVRSLLSQQTDSEVNAWLGRHEQRRLLRRYAEDTWLDDLLDRYQLLLGYNYSQDRGDLVLDRDALPEPEQMQQSIQQAFGDDAQSTVIVLSSGDRQPAWKVTTANGQRYLMTWKLVQYDASAAPAVIRGRLAQPVLQLGIDVIDDEPHATERLLQAASRLASDGAIAFDWTEHGFLWAGDRLADRLAWQDRAPVEAATSEMSLVLMPSSEAADADDDLTLQQWADELQAAGGTIPVRVRQSLERLEETIPAQLIRVDIEKYDLHIQLEANGQLDPLAKAGRRFTCGIYSVRKR